jgi:hypothetical protein
VRREYREAATYWHQTVDALDKLKLTDGTQRAFPAPGMILSDREEPVKADLLFINDFNLDGGRSALADIRDALSRKLTVAVFHWRCYDLDAAEPLNSRLRQLAQATRLRIIAPGERVSAEKVIVGNPAILQHAIDRCPRVEFDSLIIRVDQMGAHPASEDPKYDQREVRANLRKLFGTEGVWTEPEAVSSAAP